MDFGAALGQGFAILLSPSGLAACIIGLMAGIVVGLLPGISSLGGLVLAVLLLALLQPTAFNQPTSVAGFAGAVFVVSYLYGTLYGRGLAAINQLASESRKLVAKDLPNQSLMIFGVIVGVLVAGVAGMIAAGSKFPPYPYFGPAEYASIVIFILLAGAAFSSGSITTALAMAVLGLLLSVVGSDPETGARRLTFDVPGLADGISPLVVAVGLFGVASAIYGLDQVGVARGRTMGAPDVPLPRLIFKSLIGIPAGLLPTNGAAVVSSVSERRARTGADPLDPASQTNVGEIVGATIASDLRLSVSLVPAFTLLIGFDVISAQLANLPFFWGGAWAAVTTKAWLVCATLMLLHAVPLTMLARS